MRRIASAIMLILLIGILTLTSNVKIVKAYYYYNFTITVIPESPTPQNKVNVTVSLETACINYVVNFSTRSQSGNDFSITIDIYVPQIGLPAIGWAAETYNLGKLLADTYSFNAEVRVWDYTGSLLELLYYGKSFTVAYEITVPDDYPTIQEAINAASDGDTVFARNGTYYENVVMNKTVSLIGEDRNNTIIDGNGFGHVVRITTNNVTIASFTVLNSMLEPPYSGIYLHNVKNSNIGRNIILNGYRGLWLYNSSRNIIEDNIISNISESLAIWLDKSNDNVILANFISNCSSGIYLGYSNNNKVQNNDVSNNTYYGITLVYSNGTTINGNILFNNAEWNGISLYVSNNNSITGNSILKSTRGLKISESHGNIMYHNNFINNTHQVIVSYSSNNAWDNGCEGNYWRNYNGTDLNGDGIGDTNLSWESVDYYPLMNLYWNPADVNHDLKVDIYDAVLACAAYSSTPSNPHWNPHCDIAEPYGVIDIYDITMICTNYGEEYNP